MAKVDFKPGNMLYPLPVIMLTVKDKAKNNSNIITLAWAGTINSDPAMISVSVRKERYSYPLLMEQKEFCINLTTKELAFATDRCGVKSGRNTDKWKDAGLTSIPCSAIDCDMIEESPVNIECRVVKSEDLGSHTIFFGEVVAVHADDRYMDEKGSFSFESANPIAYSHGKYYTLGEYLGKFGYSVEKKKK